LYGIRKAKHMGKETINLPGLWRHTWLYSSDCWWQWALDCYFCPLKFVIMYPLIVMSSNSYDDSMYLFFGGFIYSCLLAVLGLSKPFLSLWFCLLLWLCPFTVSLQYISMLLDLSGVIYERTNGDKIYNWGDLLVHESGWDLFPILIFLARISAIFSIMRFQK
jgi:hypothetical protein